MAKKKGKLTKVQVVAEVKRTLKAAKKLVLELQKVEKDVKGSPFGPPPPFGLHCKSKRLRR